MAISAQIGETPFHVGDIIRVHYKIKEADDKERIQVYEGMVTGIRGRTPNKTFTVRKIGANGVGIERIYPLITPWIAKIEVKKTGTVRRAKLNYIRTKSARQVATITQQRSS